MFFTSAPHGSIDNLENSNLSKINNGIIHLIYLGLSNNRGLHPNEKVLYEITKHNGIILWCNEDTPHEFDGYYLCLK